MDYIEKAGRVLDIEIFELGRLRKRLDENFARAVEAIKEAVEARGKVVVVGVGKAGTVSCWERTRHRVASKRRRLS